jgi:hypothetical protein
LLGEPLMQRQHKKIRPLGCDFDDCSEDAVVGVFETGQIVCRKHASLIRESDPALHFQDFQRD